MVRIAGFRLVNQGSIPCGAIVNEMKGESIMYFVILTDEDGTSVEVKTKEELLKELNRGDYSERNLMNEDDYLKCGIDPNYWGRSILIVKGEIVIPKPVERVKEYEI